MIASGICDKCQLGLHCYGSSNRGSSDPFAVYVCSCDCQPRIPTFPRVVLVQTAGMVLSSLSRIKLGRAPEHADSLPKVIGDEKKILRRVVRDQLNANDPPEVTALWRQIIGWGWEQEDAEDHLAELLAEDLRRVLEEDRELIAPSELKELRRLLGLPDKRPRWKFWR